MKYRTLDEIAPEADVRPVEPVSLRALRRQRLERLATLLDGYQGPLCPLSRIEHLPRRERMSARGEHSPLAVAFADPTLRDQGLVSDRIGDAMSFFNLTWSEAHHLFCDCNYVGNTTGRIVAERVRTVANRVTFGEVCGQLRNAFATMFGRAAVG